MKVKLKQSVKEDAYLSHNREYIVMAIEIFFPNNKASYFIRATNDATLEIPISSSDFDIIDDHITDEWVVKITDRFNDKSYDRFTIFIGFEEFSDPFYMYNIVTYGGEYEETFNRLLAKEEKWYYDKAVDDFFEKHNDKFIPSEKEELIKYYKAQNNPERMEKDLEIDDFFRLYNEDFTPLETETMKKYYKSQPDYLQWEKDKELLTLR